jgi:solute carrier family 20 (sodium-dependent phosphate transporter)
MEFAKLIITSQQGFTVIVNMENTKTFTWILALVTVFFCISSFGNGANDVANSYANSVAARTLTLPQVGILAIFTEFIGAVALGAKVTNTIKNGILDSSRFVDTPATLMLAMSCAEAGSAAWLIIATRFGFPVSTTQTVVGAIIGAGIASGASVHWGWRKNSVSQIAASWIISPLVAGLISSVLFGSMKYCILERSNPFRKARRAIHCYLAFTAGVLALFMVVESPNLGSIKAIGTGKVYGIVFGSFFGMLLISYIFFDPFFERRLVKRDARVRFYHIPLGPLLRRENCWLYFPAREDRQIVIDYYNGTNSVSTVNMKCISANILQGNTEEGLKLVAQQGPRTESTVTTDSAQTQITTVENIPTVVQHKVLTPQEKFLEPTSELPLYKPERLWSWLKYILLQGVTRDCISHNDDHIKNALEKAVRYDIEVEYLWTFAQVASCVIMSIAHGESAR